MFNPVKLANWPDNKGIKFSSEKFKKKKKSAETGLTGQVDVGNRWSLVHDCAMGFVQRGKKKECLNKFERVV